jgi:hypothetical protein
MSAMPTTAYHPKCDTCGALYEDAEYGEMIFGDRTSALEYAADMGWLRDGNELTCPSCLRCARCGEWPAWVGGDTYASHGQILCETCEPGPARIGGVA